MARHPSQNDRFTRREDLVGGRAEYKISFDWDDEKHLHLQSSILQLLVLHCGLEQPELVLAQMKIPPDSVVAAAKQIAAENPHKKIAAIKELRFWSQHHMDEILGLKEAKDLIEAAWKEVYP